MKIIAFLISVIAFIAIAWIIIVVAFYVIGILIVTGIGKIILILIGVFIVFSAIYLIISNVRQKKKNRDIDNHTDIKNITMEKSTLVDLNRNSKQDMKVSIIMLFVGVILFYIMTLLTSTIVMFILAVLSVLLIMFGIRFLIKSLIELSTGNKKSLLEIEKWESEIQETNVIIKKIENDYEGQLNNFILQHGDLTKELQFGFENIQGRILKTIDKSVLVFESSSILIISNKIYEFKNILDFNVYDNSQTIFSANSAISSTNTGSMVGRAAMGGILFGGVGAAIGGATAKKEIQISGSSTYTTHDYEIVITVNSLSTPTVKLSLLGQQDIVQEITSILLIILERNKQHI